MTWDSPWVTRTNMGPGAACGHGTPYGTICWHCQHPAVGTAVPSFTLGGWECPRCHACWSPSVTRCPNCPQQVPAVPENDLCVPVSEGGMCDHDDEPQQCKGGRHCSC